MPSIFLSRPNWVPDAYAPGLDGFLRVLNQMGVEARTVGKTDYPSKAPLQAVLDLMRACDGAIVLGYPQLTATSGWVKDRSISGALVLPTEWNHIEASLAFAAGLPTLMIHHPGIARGVFDRGAVAGFLYEVDLSANDWPLRDDIQGALATWKAEIASIPSHAATASAVEPANGDEPLRYCRRCGTTPGRSSKCSGTFTAHEWATTKVPLFCGRCGAVPGEFTGCNGTYTAHDWQSA